MDSIPYAAVGMNTSKQSPNIPSHGSSRVERASPAKWELEIHDGHRVSVSGARLMTELQLASLYCRHAEERKQVHWLHAMHNEGQQSIQKHNDIVSSTPLDRVRARPRISARDDLGPPLRAICPWLQPSRLEECS